MKKTLKVTVTHELEIDIPDHLTTEQYLQHFSSFMWEVESSNELFEHVAYCAVNGYDFAEGLGELLPPNSEKTGVVVKKAQATHEYEFPDED